MSPTSRVRATAPKTLAALRSSRGQSVRRPEPTIEFATPDAIRRWEHWTEVTASETTTLRDVSVVLSRGRK